MTTSVAVVGGGPAGLIAAETLAKGGAQVTVFEHKRSVGRKFLLAGRGGLNITHSEPFEDLIARYGDRSETLRPALERFTPTDLQAWCTELDEEIFVGSSGRVFPASFRATPLLRAWLQRLSNQGVQFATGHRWTGWNAAGDLQFDTADGSHDIATDAALFALGGASWPRVGSDGAWVAPFAGSGVAIAPLEAANCGARFGWSDIFRDRFEGEPIKNATFTVDEQDVRGDVVITKHGLEGGPIYALGPALRASLAADGLGQMTIDTQPDLDHDRLVERLTKRRSGATATRWLHSAGVLPVVVSLCREATNNDIPDDPATMARILKALPLPIVSLEPLDRAISSAGGIRIGELDRAFMLTHRPGTFVAGEMLDWEAPTGGYLLQACFSTGVAAAEGALAFIGNTAAN